jgi:hypothetical protein
MWLLGKKSIKKHKTWNLITWNVSRSRKIQSYIFFLLNFLDNLSSMNRKEIKEITQKIEEK